MAKNTKDQEQAKPSDDSTASRKKKVVVEVICEGTLGHKLLKKGERTSDLDYVALLDDERDLVREVK